MHDLALGFNLFLYLRPVFRANAICVSYNSEMYIKIKCILLMFALSKSYTLLAHL